VIEHTSRFNTIGGLLRASTPQLSELARYADGLKFPLLSPNAARNRRVGSRSNPPWLQTKHRANSTKYGGLLRESALQLSQLARYADGLKSPLLPPNAARNRRVGSRSNPPQPQAKHRANSTTYGGLLRESTLQLSQLTRSNQILAYMMHL
jgi:hypothetical protein